MANELKSIDEATASFIAAQRVFFVATAPLNADGLLNLSPKGLGTFTVLDPATAAYLDLTGSGIETAAHLRENGRIVIMFCAFEGTPRIVRLHGTGEVIEPGSPEFAGLVARFPARQGARSVIRIRVRRVSSSCGFGVPLMDFRGERPTLDEWAERRGESGLSEYRRKKNRFSIDGLPGLTI